MSANRRIPAVGFEDRMATVEFLPPLPTGLTKAEFMARMEDVIETRTNQLIAQARGGPVKPSVLVEWNGRKNVKSPPAPTPASI